jgi:hypothetical protein
MFVCKDRGTTRLLQNLRFIARPLTYFVWYRNARLKVEIFFNSTKLQKCDTNMLVHVYERFI